MFGFLRKLFGESEAVPVPQERKSFFDEAVEDYQERTETVSSPKTRPPGYSIEYHPELGEGRYYPMYKGHYFDVHYSSGRINLKEPLLFDYCEYASTRAGAEKMIDTHIAQQTVRVIEL